MDSDVARVLKLKDNRSKWPSDCDMSSYIFDSRCCARLPPFI